MEAYCTMRRPESCRKKETHEMPMTFPSGAGRGKFEIDEDRTTRGRGRVGAREYSFPQTASKLCSPLCLCFSECSWRSWIELRSRKQEDTQSAEMSAYATDRQMHTCPEACVCVCERYNQSARKPTCAALRRFITNFYQQGRARTSSD